jgi:porin
MKRSRWSPPSRLLTTAVLAVGSPALAQSESSDRLTGSWGGLRTSLAERGVTFDVDWTNYYQGLVSGDGDKGFQYGGRADALLTVDTGRAGLWEGGALRTHTEYRYGSLGSSFGGALVPTNAGLVLPTGKPEDVVVTSIHLAQRIGDRISVLLGKISPVDLLAADPFYGGGGQTRFLNVAFSAPPSGVTPPVFFGAVASVRSAPMTWTFMVMDPDDRTRDYWPDSLFSNGVTFSLSANYAGRAWERTSSISATATYSTKNGANLAELLLPPDLQTGDRDHSWHVGLQFSQFVHENPQRPTEGWGLFLKIGGSAGNPNPYQGTLIGGVGGKGLFEARPDDSFGVGYFYVDFSDELQSSLNPFLRFTDEQGVEAFYNYVVKDWLMVSGDLQYVNPALGDTKNAFVTGVRVRLRL